MIALTTNLSRRKAEEFIKRGEITINGVTTKEMGVMIDPLKDKIAFQGRILRLPERFFYLAFFKPRNVMVTKNDPQGRPIIWKYLEEWKARLNSVGRLDFDSEGLLLLTNDGLILNKLTHPRHEVEKVYEVKVKGEMRIDAIEKLKSGVELSDGITQSAQIKVKGLAGDVTWLEIGIKEGRNRQIRRMCDAVGHPVLKLKRLAVGSIKLGDLKPGQWRHLTPKEVNYLKNEIIG